MIKKDIINKIHDTLYPLSLKNKIKSRKTITEEHFYLNNGKRITVYNLTKSVKYYNGINNKKINTLEECEDCINDFLK